MVLILFHSLSWFGVFGPPVIGFFFLHDIKTPVTAGGELLFSRPFWDPTLFAAACSSSNVVNIFGFIHQYITGAYSGLLSSPTNHKVKVPGIYQINICIKFIIILMYLLFSLNFNDIVHQKFGTFRTSRSWVYLYQRIFVCTSLFYVFFDFCYILLWIVLSKG